MFGMVNVMRMDDPLQISTCLLRSPAKSLMYDDIMKYKIEHAVAKNPEASRDHVRIKIDLCEIIKKSNGWQTEDDGE
jgi:hypothetical protein